MTGSIVSDNQTLGDEPNQPSGPTHLAREVDAVVLVDTWISASWIFAPQHNGVQRDLALFTFNCSLYQLISHCLTLSESAHYALT